MKNIKLELVKFVYQMNDHLNVYFFFKNHNHIRKICLYKPLLRDILKKIEKDKEISEPDSYAMKQFIHRLISYYGARYDACQFKDERFSHDWKEKKEKRKKETSEVDGTTSEGENTHGGDSQSGEVPEGNSGSGSDEESKPSDGQGSSPSERQSSAGEGNGDLDSDRTPPLQGESEFENIFESECSGNGSNNSLAEQSESLDSETEGSLSESENSDSYGDASGQVQDLSQGGSFCHSKGVPEKASQSEDGEQKCKLVNDKVRGHDEGNSAQLIYKSTDFPVLRKKQGGLQGSEKNRDSSGGCYLNPDESASIPFRYAKRMKKKLEALINDYSPGVGKISHRVDGHKLMKEIKSKRINLNNIFKEEKKIKPVLLAVDVSGSCHVSCDYTLQVAISIAKEMPETCKLLIHSNGFPVEIWWEGVTLVQSWFDYDWAACFAWGDFDAGDELNKISKNCDTYLFDDYCINKDNVSYKKINQIHYFSSVRGADGTIKALNKLKRYY